MGRLTKRPKGMILNDTDGAFSAILYQTEIVHFKQQWLTLRHGGWLTKHTKNCINLVLSHYELGISVSQVKGKWIVSNQDGKSVPFQDGMRISI